MSAPVELLVQVSNPRIPDEPATIVARTPGGRNVYVGTMTPEELLKTARLFVATAVGEDAVSFMLDCLVIGAESAAADSSPADAAFRLVQAWTPPVEAVATS